MLPALGEGSRRVPQRADLPRRCRPFLNWALLYGVDRHGVNGWAALWADPEQTFTAARDAWGVAHPDDPERGPSRGWGWR